MATSIEAESIKTPSLEFFLHFAAFTEVKAATSSLRASSACRTQASKRRKSSGDEIEQSSVLDWEKDSAKLDNLFKYKVQTNAKTKLLEDMTTFEWSAETAALLKKKGLRCICQLCDCGRPHRHRGCRKPYPNVAYTMKQIGSNTMETDYQARFGKYHHIPPPESLKPKESERDLNPPPMDFRTENKLAFKAFKFSGKVKPCKLEEELGKLISGDFNENTVYKETYVGHQPLVVGLARPKTVFKSESGIFASETEYSDTYHKKNKVSQEQFSEKPTTTYGLLYPNPEPTAKRSIKNCIHDGRPGAKAEPFVGNKNKLQFGTEEKFQNVTTHNTQFKKYDDMVPRKPIKPSHPIRKREKFSAVAQSKVDFQYDEEKANEARAVKSKEHPSLINLSMDIPSDFTTVASMSYNTWKPEQFVKSNSTKNPTCVYEPPTAKFDGVSQTRADYQTYEVTPRIGMLRPVDARKSSGKMVSKSSYSHQYPHHGIIDRKIYGEQHEDNLHLPPKSEKFSSATMMRNDFPKHSAKKRKAFKPSCASQNQGGEFSSETEYRQKFQETELEPCAFTKFLVEVEARRDARLNSKII